MSKLSQAENIRRYFQKHPEKTVREVADAMGVKYQIAYMVKRGMEKKMYKEASKKYAEAVKPIMAELVQQKDGAITEKVWTTVHISSSDTPLPVTMEEPKADPVNHPAHYKTGGIETIDFIEAKELNYNLGNVVKYVTRADHKGNRKQDLEKALWYLTREISSMKG